jgi:hypothetical protein
MERVTIAKRQRQFLGNRKINPDRKENPQVTGVHA